MMKLTCTVIFSLLAGSMPGASALDAFNASRAPFADDMPNSDIPQFITLTFDDSITPMGSSLIEPLTQIVDRRGCGVKATFYVSIEGNTVCSLVRGVHKGLHEIATHTYNHIGTPGVEEIQGAKTYLAEECGIPAEEIRGFRAPFLQYSQDTLDNLKDLGFLYDSSIPALDAIDSNYGRDHVWPFTFTQASTEVFKCDLCSSTPLTPNAGLWEIPMWMHYNADGSRQIPMDYTGDLNSLLDTSFERRYNGNRAPMGIFLHAGWLQSKGSSLKAWIEKIMAAHDDVYFVTSNELIEYMRDPVPKSQYQNECAGQVRSCFPPSVSNCVHGTFNSDTCSCDCPTPWCKDAQGDCTIVSYTGCGAPSPVATLSPVASPVQAPVTTQSPVVSPVQAPVTTQSPVVSPVQAPVTTQAPVASPVAAPVTPSSTDKCCPTDYSGMVGYNNCQSYFQCNRGEVVAGSTSACPNGLVFDANIGNCNWPSAAAACSPVSCQPQNTNTDPTESPVAAPVTPSASPSQAPVGSVTDAPLTTTDSPAASPVAAATPSSTCCPAGFSGYRGLDNCNSRYRCASGVVIEPPTPCTVGLVFDTTLQVCVWSWQATSCDLSC